MYTVCCMYSMYMCVQCVTVCVYTLIGSWDLSGVWSLQKKRSTMFVNSHTHTHTITHSHHHTLTPSHSSPLRQAAEVHSERLVRRTHTTQILGIPPHKHRHLRSYQPTKKHLVCETIPHSYINNVFRMLLIIAMMSL